MIRRPGTVQVLSVRHKLRKRKRPSTHWPGLGWESSSRGRSSPHHCHHVFPCLTTASYSTTIYTCKVETYLFVERPKELKTSAEAGGILVVRKRAKSPATDNRSRSAPGQRRVQHLHGALQAEAFRHLMQRGQHLVRGQSARRVARFHSRITSRHVRIFCGGPARPADQIRGFSC